MTAHQQNVLQFYEKDACLPFEPIVAQGPWLVTVDGNVVYDVGGYGMLGFGHSPTWCRDILSKPHVMANILTPSHLQDVFTTALQTHIGCNRLETTNSTTCPYSHFAFLNSGSEAMELALRITDIRENDDSYNHYTVVTGIPTYVGLKNGFHGRTTQAARISDSSRSRYHQLLRSTAHILQVNMNTVPINNVEALESKFKWLAQIGRRIDAVVFEPVMGEGNPGVMVDRAFYRVARKLTEEQHIPLIVDSVQAGIRATGYLSCVDYPELRNEKPPDMEVFSKAIGSGQYPLSVLACTPQIAKKYPVGIYGNTMTGNPKAMEIGYETLRRVDDALIHNIQRRGAQFKQTLEDIAKKRSDIVEDVTGTGLLLALHLHPRINVMDVERRCRMNGLNVIHGGKNALRFTPWFCISEQEVNLIGKLLVRSL